MKKLIIILLAALVVLLALWVGLLARQTSSTTPKDKASDYSAVYLSTGDIYFGKLSWFPKAKLRDAWLLQRTGTTEQARYVMVPFRSALWEPVGTLWLNAKQVIFWTKIRAGSDTERKLKDAMTDVQNSQTQPQTGIPQGTGQ